MSQKSKQFLHYLNFSKTKLYSIFSSNHNFKYLSKNIIFIQERLKLTVTVKTFLNRGGKIL